MSMHTATPPPELPPTAPPEPDPNSCCQSGCTYCVLDLYQDELAQYRRALAAWQLRQGGAADAVKTPPTRP
jgi:hypothetical protein